MNDGDARARAALTVAILLVRKQELRVSGGATKKYRSFQSKHFRPVAMDGGLQRHQDHLQCGIVACRGSSTGGGRRRWGSRGQEQNCSEERTQQQKKQDKSGEIVEHVFSGRNSVNES